MNSKIMLSVVITGKIQPTDKVVQKQSVFYFLSLHKLKLLLIINKNNSIWSGEHLHFLESLKIKLIYSS